ncbi:MAG: 50S ribosomal protein L31 [Planctomycetota bacterium]
MKTGIHPEYVVCKVKCNCGEEFTTRSTKAKIVVEICYKCHPFYTGKNKFVDTEGRVERFQNKFAGKYAESVKVKKPKLEKMPKVKKFKEEEKKESTVVPASAPVSTTAETPKPSPVKS